MNKAIFISFNQALNERVMQVLDRNGARGFSKWELTLGRGSIDGEPHYASHAWPSMNSSVLTIVPADCAQGILNALRAIDASAPQHGLRAFVWHVEDGI